MRFARNKRAFGRAWDKTVERFGGRRGETTNPIIKGIMPDGSETPGHRGRWKKTETSNPRDTQWLQTYRQERSARLKRSDAVRASLERIAAGVLAGTMALTGRGLLTPNVVNKAAMDKKQELRQIDRSINNKQRRDEMSLENTLREMMNEMKMPEKGEPDPTVHTGPKKPPFDPTVHSGPKDSEKYKRSLEAHKPKPKILKDPHMNEGRITDKIRTAVGRISGAIDKKADEYVPYVRTDGRGRKTGLNPRDTDTLHGHHISPRAVAALGLATTLAVSNAGDRVGGQFDLHKAQEEGQRASASVQSAYQGLQNVARSAQQVPKLAPGAEAAKKPPFFKPRRRLEETLKDHYKQRLDEKLDRSKVAGTLAQRTAREGHAAGIPASLVDLAAARARKQGTPDTRDHQYRVKRDEWWRGRRFGRGGLTPRERDVIGPDGVPDIRYTTAERLGLPTKAIGLMYSKIDAANTKEYGVSRRERGLKAEAETGYIAARRAASQARKRERGIAEHYEQD